MRPLAQDLIWKLVVVSVVLGVVVLAAQLTAKYGEERQAIIGSLQRLADGFSPGLEAAVWDYQESLTQNIVDGIGTNPLVVGVSVVSSSGEPLATWKREGADRSADLRVVKELYHEQGTDGQRSTGLLTIWSSPTILNESQSRHLRESVLAMALVLGALIALLWLYTQFVIARPLIQFSHQVKALADAVPQKRTIDLGRLNIIELQTLQEGFNNLLAQIDESQRQVTLANQDLERRVEERTRELTAAKLQAEEASRIKGDFLANLSHEIRTPMNAIIGFSKLLTSLPLGVEQQEYVGIIRSSAASLLIIINDILDFSKIESGKMQVEEIPFSLREVMEEVTQMSSLQAQSKGIVFQSVIDGSLSDRYVGDPLRIRQVLNNLCNNAVKFTNEGGVEVLVRAEAGPEGTPRLRFYVQDTGIGMSAEDQTQIFQAFSQVDTSITRRFGGTGLGLSISSQLAQLMGGHIGLTSGEGQGSTFWLDLPLRAWQAQPVVVSVSHSDGHPEATTEFTAPLAGAKLLVVDDNPINLLIARKVLEKAGASVTTATNGREAIAKVEAGAFTLVLMDVQMPEMDGYEATAALRQRPEFADLPIIALTAHAMESARKECLKAGMNDYLSKPIVAETMISIVTRWSTRHPIDHS